jgi:hypothetical protein
MGSTSTGLVRVSRSARDRSAGGPAGSATRYRGVRVFPVRSSWRRPTQDVAVHDVCLCTRAHSASVAQRPLSWGPAPADRMASQDGTRHRDSLIRPVNARAARSPCAAQTDDVRSGSVQSETGAPGRPSVHSSGANSTRAGRHLSGPLCGLSCEFCPRCDRIAVLGARSVPRDTGNQPRALPGYQGQSPWLVLAMWPAGSALGVTPLTRGLQQNPELRGSRRR